jgi:hypothetical protein
MDGHRFDDLARSLAGGLNRRRFLTGLATGAVAAALGRGGAAAACATYGQPCTPASGCCNGSTCQGGVCRCPAGASVCNTINGPACVACPPDQLLGAGCRCLCAASGRPPDPATGLCPCPNGQQRCGGACVDTGANPNHCGGCELTCFSSNACETATCQGGSCVCSAFAGAACDDGNRCTVDDICQADGACAGVPIDCSALDDQCVVGSCDPTTGACYAASRPDQTPCTGTDACFRTYACQAGACVGGDPIDCEAADACQVAGACDPATGACSNPPAAAGVECGEAAWCRDGVARGADQCDGNGACVPGTEVACFPYLCGDDACRTSCVSDADCAPAAHCDADGQCRSDHPLGGACDGPGDCESGFCVGGVCCNEACEGECWVCSAENGGVCSPSTGQACSTGEACTSGVCQAGVCTPGDPVVCPDCQVCDPDAGGCVVDPAQVGTFCNQPFGGAWMCGTCQADGSCTGGFVVCDSLEQCTHGVCDRTTGQCAMGPAPNGTSCNPLGGTDDCTAGTCQEGVCTATPLPELTPCDRSWDLCATGPGICLQGSCQPHPWYYTHCWFLGYTDDCQGRYECDGEGGCMVVPDVAPDGTPCSTGDPCAEEEFCYSGACVGNPRTTCPYDPCQMVEMCPNGKGCYRVGYQGEGTTIPGEPCKVCDGYGGAKNLADNVSCDDGDPCTRGNYCSDGECVASEVWARDENELCDTIYPGPFPGPRSCCGPGLECRVMPGDNVGIGMYCLRS